MQTQKLKSCSICREALPLTCFHRRRHYVKAGYRAACKKCTGIRAAQRRQVKAVESNPEVLALQKLKRNVRAKTRLAVRRGELVAKPCEFCGEIAQAHHPDYEMEGAHLNVRWLCVLHHAEEHAVRDWTKQLELRL